MTARWNPALLLLAAAASFAPTSAYAGATEVSPKMRRLLDKRVDDPDARELFELARKKTVRAWLRERYRGARDSGDRIYLGDERKCFAALVLSGAAQEEVELLAEAPDGHGFVGCTQILLERAPPSLDVGPLLFPIARHAAGRVGDHYAASCLWLLAHRLPLERVRAALEKAWGEVGPRPDRLDGKLGYVEITVLGPDGKRPEGLIWISALGNYGPSGLVIWPDGKARLCQKPDAGQESVQGKLTLSVPGFRESARVPVEYVRGRVTPVTATLGERRAAVKGRLSPPPKAPLFAHLHSGLTLGHELERYDLPRGDLSSPVRPDGSFRAPANSAGATLLIVDVDGAVQLVRPVAEPVPAGGELDIGEVPMPPKRDLIDVPIYVDWPGEVPRGEVFQGDIDWKPEAPGVPEGRTHFYEPFWKRTGRIFVGLARNVPPGKYALTVTFAKEEKQGEVGPAAMDFTVKGPKDVLVLRPKKKAVKAK